MKKSRSKASIGGKLPPITSKSPSPDVEGAMSARSGEDALSDLPSAQPKAKRGRRKKKTKDDKDQKPATPPYMGPPPTEELLSFVHSQAKIHTSIQSPNLTEAQEIRKLDNFESTYNMIREGETQIGCEVNTRNGYGFTPLAIAAAAGDASTVALLLERRADASLASLNRAELPLHHAATYQHSVVAQLLVEPSRKAGVLDARTCTGWTPLHLCCSSGDANILRVLLKAKANMETRNPQTGDEHALHCAARNTNLDIIEILLAADADVNCTDSLSRTPLHLSAINGSLDGVSLLLRSRADPHHRGGPRHLTPLDCVPSKCPEERKDAATSAKHMREIIDAYELVERDKVLRILTSYMRPAPQPFRVDTRFDRRDSRSLI